MGILNRWTFSAVRAGAVLGIALGLVTTTAAAPLSRVSIWPGDGSSSAALYRGNAARTGAQPGPAPSSKPRELWQKALNEPMASSAVVAGGVVYANDWRAGIHALDVESGEELWRVATGGGDSIPAVVDGVVYTGGSLGDGDSGVLFAFDAESGHKIWSYATDYPIGDSSLVFVDGVVYVGSGDDEETAGGLHAVVAKTGEELWSVQTGAPILSSPAVADGVLYVGGGGLESESNGLYAVDAETGEQLWMFETDDDPIMSAPAVADGLVYASGFWGFYALDAESGEVVWTINDEESMFDASPAVVDGKVYVGGADLLALDAATGEAIWTYTGADAYVGSPVVVDEVIYVATFGGEVIAVDGANGGESWRLKVDVDGDSDHRKADGSLAIVDGVIYFTSRDVNSKISGGAIHAIGIV